MSQHYSDPAPVPELRDALREWVAWAEGMRRWPLSMGCSPVESERRTAEVRALEQRARALLERLA